MHPKDADGMANSVEPDQTAPLHCMPRLMCPCTKNFYGMQRRWNKVLTSCIKENAVQIYSEKHFVFADWSYFFFIW